MANFNFNKVILGGRLTAEPELKQTSTGIPVVSFSVAINRRVAKNAEQKADFINCRAWRERAEFLARYFHKGSSISIDFVNFVSGIYLTSRDRSAPAMRWSRMKSTSSTAQQKAARRVRITTRTQAIRERQPPRKSPLRSSRSRTRTIFPSNLTQEDNE